MLRKTPLLAVLALVCGPAVAQTIPPALDLTPNSSPAGGNYGDLQIRGPGGWLAGLPFDGNSSHCLTGIGIFASCSSGGGSTPPGGSTGQIQTNNAGAFGGVTPSNGIGIVSGILQPTYGTGANTVMQGNQTCGGDLSGPCVAPTVVSINGQPVSTYNRSTTTGTGSGVLANLADIGRLTEADPGQDYTASGALSPSDTLSIVNSASTCAMTLAAGTYNGQEHRIKRYGAGTVTVTATIDGTANATLTANSSTLKEMLHLVWSAAKSTWLVSS